MSSQLWSGASYERIAETFAPIHLRVVEVLDVRPGQAFLDVACGTGGVALRAARRGADVTGVDISADQLAKARAAADEERLPVRLDEGDCQALRYAVASFDAVASVFGLIFAESRERTAAEVARVTRPGGRLAFTAWYEDDWVRVGRAVGRPEPPGDSLAWSDREHVRELLGEAFELEFEAGEWLVTGSPAELWELASTSAPPLANWLATLDETRRAEVERAYLAVFASGEMRRPYLLVLGTRR